MKIYNFILQGHEATEQNATDAARGLDWQSEETAAKDEFAFNNSNYFDTINGIEIHYNFSADYYFFAEVEKNEILSLEFSSLKSCKKYKLVTVEKKDGFFAVYLQSFGALSGVYCGECLINKNIFGTPDLNHVLNALNLNNLKFEI